MSKPIHIAVLSGSVRIGRKSPQVAEHLAKQLESEHKNATVEYLDLEDYDLPVMQERRGLHPNLPGAAEKLGKRLEAADAIIIVSPEYNGGYPGSLKNALDYYYVELTKKPIGIVSVSSGQQGGIQAWEKLVGLFAKIGSFIAPTRMNVADVADVFDENGKMTSDFYQKASDKYLADFLWFAEAITAKKRG